MPPAMKQLEQIVHPMLGRQQQQFFDDAERSGAPVVVVDVRCLLRPAARSASTRGGGTTTPEIQRERILARDKMTGKNSTPSCAATGRRRKTQNARISWWDTSHGLDPVRLRIRDILEQAAKMPRRPNLIRHSQRLRIMREFILDTETTGPIAAR